MSDTSAKKLESAWDNGLIAPEFDDFETDTDDSEAIEAYALELKAAVEAFGVPVLENGGIE